MDHRAHLAEHVGFRRKPADELTRSGDRRVNSDGVQRRYLTTSTARLRRLYRFATVRKRKAGVGGRARGVQQAFGTLRQCSPLRQDNLQVSVIPSSSNLLIFRQLGEDVDEIKRRVHREVYVLAGNRMHKSQRTRVEHRPRAALGDGPRGGRRHNLVSP